MATRPRKARRPRDANQLAKLIVDLSTGEASEEKDERSALSVTRANIGRQGGLKGGPARRNALSHSKLKEIAKKAAAARWKKKRSVP
jgi:hypothetical protein